MNNSFKEKLMYRVDNIMTKGSFSIIVAFSILVIFIIFLLTVLIWFLGSNPDQGFSDQLWIYFNTGFGRSATDGSWVYRIITFLLILISIFFSSIIIGSIASEINSKILELRQGKSKVIESNPTIILGWSESLYIIINELIEANRNQHSSCIVILGSKNNIEMQEDIVDKILPDNKTKIIFRSGSTSSPEDLSRLNIGNAKSIIINIDDDIEVVKTILAIFKDKKVQQREIPIACKINDSANLSVAEIAGQGVVKFLPVYNFLGRIDAQACLQPGVAEVLLDLLDFAGSEVYFHTEGSLIGQTYKDAVLSYDACCVVGIRKNNKILINPSPDALIEELDQLVMIALDDDEIKLTDYQSNDFSIKKTHSKINKISGIPKHLHILGWNNASPVILNDLIGYLPVKSKITIASRSSEMKKYLEELNLVKDISIKHYSGDIRNRDFLESIDIANTTNVLLLSSSVYDNHESADAATLFSLLNLRDIRKENNSDFTILSEVLNSKNSELISVEKSDDFVMSERIINLMLVQLSENPDLDGFFNELMQPDGSEIYFRQISQYVNTTNDVTFGEITASALNNAETAIGYRINKEANNKSCNFGIYINPNKLDKIRLNNNDQLIVFSLD